MNGRSVAIHLIRFVISFFAILTIVFLLPRLMPGDPVQNVLGIDYISAAPDEIAFYTHKYGLDKSLLEQYVLFLQSIFSLDFGHSFTTEMDVLKMISKGMIDSLKVVLPGLLIGSYLAFVAGLFGGTRKGSIIERFLTGSSILIHAMPSFLVGILMLITFAYHFEVFPLGHMSTGTGTFLDTIYCLTLPVLTLSLIVFTGYYLIIRAATLQICEEHFITVKRAHGFSEDHIKSNHISKNISTQFVSMLAMSLGGVISGSLIIEIVFSLNGMGSILYNAISFGDYPVIQGSFIFITFSVLLFNLLAEILYGFLDPRISEGDRQ